MFTQNPIIGPVHTAYFLRGLPGAGKSTVAGMMKRSTNCHIVAFDDFWRASGVTPSVANSTQRWGVYQAAINTALRYLQFGDVVIDCTSRSFAFRKYVSTLFQAAGSRVVFINCETIPSVTRRRVAARWILDPSHPSKGTRHFDSLVSTFDRLPDRNLGVTVFFVDTSGSYPRLLRGEGPHVDYHYPKLQHALESSHLPESMFSDLRRLIQSFLGRFLERLEDAITMR